MFFVKVPGLTVRIEKVNLFSISETKKPQSNGLCGFHIGSRNKPPVEPGVYFVCQPNRLLRLCAAGGSVSLLKDLTNIGNTGAIFNRLKTGKRHNFVHENIPQGRFFIFRRNLQLLLIEAQAFNKGRNVRH